MQALQLTDPPLTTTMPPPPLRRELALQWLESNRAVMYDESKADWFLQFTDGRGHKNGTIFNNRREEGDQYFIDWRNPDAAAYFVGSIVRVVSDPAVDGTHTDDREGLPNEHPTVAAQLRMSAADMAALQFATQSAGQYLATSLAASNKTCTDCLAGAYLANAPSPAAAARARPPCAGCASQPPRPTACSLDLMAAMPPWQPSWWRAHPWPTLASSRTAGTAAGAHCLS